MEKYADRYKECLTLWGVVVILNLNQSTNHVFFFELLVNAINHEGRPCSDHVIFVKNNSLV